MSKRSPFDWLKLIQSNHSLTIEDELQINSYSPFMINRIFSNDDSLLPIVDYLNMIPISNKLHYNVMKTVYYMVYRGSNKFIPYSKGSPKDKDLPYLMNYFKINEKTAINHKKLLDIKEIKKIISEARAKENFKNKLIKRG